MAGALNDLTVAEPSEELSSVGTEELIRELIARGQRAPEPMSVRLDPFGAVMPLHPGVRVEIPADGAALGGLAPVLAIDLGRRSEAVVDNRFGRAFLQWGFACFPGDAVEDTVVVELGCGSQNPFAMSMLYALLGARRALGVDLVAPQHDGLAAVGVARVAAMMATDPRLLVDRWPVTRRDVARRLDGFDLLRLWEGDLGGLDRQRVDVHVGPAERLPLDDGEADYVFSGSFLEHVEDADAVAAEVARVVKPGGWTWHVVDGHDHKTYEDPSWPPLGFLREPAHLPMVNGSNRLRPLQFVEVFERHGFEAVASYPYLYMPVGDDERAAFVEPWRSMPGDVLAVRGAVLSFRRRPRVSRGLGRFFRRS